MGNELSSCCEPMAPEEGKQIPSQWSNGRFSEVQDEGQHRNQSPFNAYLQRRNHTRFMPETADHQDETIVTSQSAKLQGDNFSGKLEPRSSASVAHKISSPCLKLEEPRDKDGVQPGGIGVVFVEDKEGKLFVHLIVEGGPAHRSGRIAHGDIILKVDGVKALFSASPTFPDINGPSGDAVVLTCLRTRTGGDGFIFDVTITRDAQYYPDTVAQPPPGKVLANPLCQDNSMPAEARTNT